MLPLLLKLENKEDFPKGKPHYSRLPCIDQHSHVFMGWTAAWWWSRYIWRA